MREGIGALARVAAALGLLAGLTAPSAAGEPVEKRLLLGMAADAAPATPGDYACGSHGGPEGTTFNRLAEARVCPPEASGLREVYIRFVTDDWPVGPADPPTPPGRYWVRDFLGFRTLYAALLDDTLTIRGFRIETDQTSGRRQGERWHQFADHLFATARQPWSCRDLRPEAGEFAVDGVLIKQVCTTPEGVTDGKPTVLQVSAYFLRVDGAPGRYPGAPKEGNGGVIDWAALEFLEAGVARR